MSIMIPSVISPEVKSSAERKIFEWFRNAPGTGQWIVLHSLGITTHNKVIYGETDFLSLLPIWVSLHLKLRADGSGVRMEYGTSPIDTTRQAVKHVGHLIRPVTGFSVLSRQ